MKPPSHLHGAGDPTAAEDRKQRQAEAAARQEAAKADNASGSTSSTKG